MNKFNKPKTEPICPRCKAPYSEHTCYWSPCVGCKDGHSSFHKTIIESKEWEQWKEYCYKKTVCGGWDFAECESGIISAEHFKKFIEFIKKH